MADRIDCLSDRAFAAVDLSAFFLKCFVDGDASTGVCCLELSNRVQEYFAHRSKPLHRQTQVHWAHPEWVTSLRRCRTWNLEGEGTL